MPWTGLTSHSSNNFLAPLVVPFAGRCQIMMGPRTNGGAQVGVADNQMIDDHVATIRLGCFFAFSPVPFRLRQFEPPLGVRGDEMILH